MSLGAAAWRLIPGLALCLAITAVSMLAQGFEAGLFGRAWLEALVIAILLGTAVRTVWTPGPRWRPGIAFAAKPFLEVAVVLLGATISAATILAAGPALLAAIAAVVALGLTMSYGLGRMFRLPRRMATLIACGNSICGNSAIAAVAPVIGAQAKDVAASIAFTAVLGVVVVLLLPVLSVLLHMTPRSFGVFAGLTVYAVPQVLAATVPVGLISTQIGTLVKLVRVLTLGPIVIGFSLLGRGLRQGAAGPAAATRFNPLRLVPWFIVGFLVLAALRSFEILPASIAAPVLTVASLLTVVSMAALGLGVDITVLRRVGGKVTAAVTISLLLLLMMSLGIIRLFA